MSSHDLASSPTISPHLTRSPLLSEVESLLHASLKGSDWRQQLADKSPEAALTLLEELEVDFVAKRVRHAMGRSLSFRSVPPDCHPVASLDCLRRVPLSATQFCHLVAPSGLPSLIAILRSAPRLPPPQLSATERH